MLHGSSLKAFLPLLGGCEGFDETRRQWTLQQPVQGGLVQIAIYQEGMYPCAGRDNRQICQDRRDGVVRSGTGQYHSVHTPSIPIMLQAGM